MVFVLAAAAALFITLLTDLYTQEKEEAETQWCREQARMVQEDGVLEEFLHGDGTGTGTGTGIGNGIGIIIVVSPTSSSSSYYPSHWAIVVQAPRQSKGSKPLVGRPGKQAQELGQARTK